MKFTVNISYCRRNKSDNSEIVYWKEKEIRDDGYSQVYLDFVKENNIKNLTAKEQELLKLLVDNNYGNLNKIITLYKNGK